jgi:uncharacterized membrane protein
MSPETLAWVKAGHLIGVFLWISGMVAVYWLLRLHVHAPKEAHEKLIYMERSLAMMMDVASGLAIVLGLVLIFGRNQDTFPSFSDSLLVKPEGSPISRGWLHIKLAVVVLGLLPMHGMLRARIKQFGMGKISNIPNWQWSVILAAVIAIVILVTRVRYEMENVSLTAKPAAADTSKK